MKKNILGAIVIFFVTFAFLLVIRELSDSDKALKLESAEVYADE